MAIWRTKAYDLFGFKPGDYSYARGKIELFADLVEIARTAESNRDDETLDRIAGYVTWASKQNSEEIASALDLSFFLPVFHDQAIHDLFRERIPPDLLDSKWLLLMVNDFSCNETNIQTTDDGR